MANLANHFESSQEPPAAFGVFVPAPGMRLAIWTRPRLALRDWFRRNAPPIGELYEGAVELLLVLQVPGRIRFICHAVREIRNRLPDVVSGTKGPGRFDYATRLDQLADVCRSNGFDLAAGPTGNISVHNRGNDAPNTVAVPMPVIEKFRELVTGHLDAREKKREAAERLFNSCRINNRTVGDKQYIAVSEWIRITDWFEEKTHQPCEGNEVVDWKETQLRFEQFEAALGSLLREFYTTVDELDEILDKANT